MAPRDQSVTIWQDANWLFPYGWMCPEIYSMLMATNSFKRDKLWQMAEALLSKRSVIEFYDINTDLLFNVVA